MQIHPHKSFMYPVLRDGSDDYLSGRFEAQISVLENPYRQTVRLNVECSLDQPQLKALIQKGHAAYGLRIKCADTFHRECLFQQNPSFSRDYEAGRVCGRMEILPLVVCLNNGSRLESQDFHPEFQSTTFYLKEGQVLAHARSLQYYLGINSDSIGTVFKSMSTKDLKKGIFNVLWGDDLVTLQFSVEDEVQFTQARSGDQDALRGFMTGIYLPAVLSVLQEMDTYPEAHEDKKWYQVIHKELVNNNMALPGDTRSPNRLMDAQQLLKRPLQFLFANKDD